MSSHSKAVGHTPTRFPDRISVKEGALTVSHVDAEFGSEDEPTVTALFSVPKAHYGVMCEMAERYNSHDDLVEALRGLIAELSPVECLGPLGKRRVKQAEAALLKGE